MGLAALGIGVGDEVILADTNWIATIAPIVHLGATPVFVDILTDTWCIDPDLAVLAITPRTKAIIATHLYGNLVDIDRLLEVGRQHGIPIIEDAAEAIGSMWQGQRAGTMGRFGTFSFHGSKTITTGEGGSFVTNDSELFERVLTLSNHGRASDQVKQFWADEVGFKFKMSNIQAAIGCAQVERIEELIARKRQILAHYREALCSKPGITMNPEPIGTVNGGWMPTVVFDHELGVTREQLQDVFKTERIDARVFFWPASSLPMFADAVTPIAHGIPGRAMNLPSFHDITTQELDRVIATCASVIGH
jgi:perosamine synthetase